jgi:hypothetical protein
MGSCLVQYSMGITPAVATDDPAPPSVLDGAPVVAPAEAGLVPNSMVGLAISELCRMAPVMSQVNVGQTTCVGPTVTVALVATFLVFTTVSSLEA